MVGLAQMVRASDCGPEGRRFDPDIPPHIVVICGYSTVVSMQVFQTWDESSILSTRTKEWKNESLLLFFYSWEWGREKPFLSTRTK